jgi:hypothetical protein
MNVGYQGVTMKKNEQLHARRFHPPGHSNYHNIKPNVIFINSGSLIRHELSKALLAIQIHKFGDYLFNDTIKKAIKTIEKEIKNQGFSKNPTSFLTEACPNSEPNRRIDIVQLSDITRIEIETNPKEQKEAAQDGSITLTERI